MSDDGALTVYTNDFGGLSSQDVLAAERLTALHFNQASGNIAAALLEIARIQDEGLWQQHYILDAAGGVGDRVFTNFWTQYIPWFVNTYGPSMGMHYGADWIRARLRMFRALEVEGYSMQQVLNVPLDIQYMLEKLVDMEELELKGQAGSAAAAKQLIDSVMNGQIDKSSLVALTSGTEVAFYFDGKEITAVLSDSDGLIDVRIATVAAGVPAPVMARFLAKLQAKSR